MLGPNNDLDQTSTSNNDESEKNRSEIISTNYVIYISEIKYKNNNIF